MKHVLMSVTDKTGLVSFAKHLIQLFPELTIIASGGTARTLTEHGIAIKPLNEWTDFPECFGGRVKTLHPRVMGGILFKRGVDDAEAHSLDVLPIDMVVCNLYNFAEAASKPDLHEDELIEQMDIGGSTLIRSSVKNYKDVAIVTDPNDYDAIIHELKSGKLSVERRRQLAVKAINLSADYEACLAETLTRRLAEQETRRPTLTLGKKLRYGENPDQEGWVYQFADHTGIAQAEILGGKELSYNNYDDATVAFLAAESLKALQAKFGTAIIKHGNLCGYATGNTLTEAFELAWAGDPKSSFGGIISFISTVDESLCPILSKKFVEVLIAPDFSESFVAWAKEKKPNLRLLKVGENTHPKWLYKNISGGMLIQTPKQAIRLDSIETLLNPLDAHTKRGVVTKIQPDKRHKGLYAFAIAAVHFAKSNAIAIVREVKTGCYQLLGMGSGQPNRVDSLVRLAIPKAIDNLKLEHAEDAHYNPGKDLGHCVLASDGFFPFDDSVLNAASMGIKTCLQPGGSTNDQQVIDAADHAEMCMMFTGERYFCH
jgi:phosphoribosylaminoimidazolecarboxamide formyltransferase/IMP cyclohydrolase